MKKIVLIFLSFVIYFNSITANAATSMGGWSMGGAVAQGASAAYNATKNALINGKNVAKTSAAVITPAAADVAKVLGKGVAGVALSVAVEQLLGAVDWVLDPTNNQIVYTKEDPLNLPKLWFHTSDYTKFYSTADQGCRSTFSKSALDAGWKYSRVVVTGDSATCYAFPPNSTKEIVDTGLSHVANPNYDSTKEKEKKTLPLSTVAAQVISNAESNDVKAQEATMAAVADIVQDAETDNVKASPIVQQLEANAVTPTSETATGTATQTDTKTDPTTGETTTQTKTTDLTLDFPVFCGWAPTVCEAAAATIAFPITATKWWETSTKAISDAWVEAKEWASSENKNEEKDTEVELIDEALPDVNTNIFGASGECPPDFTYPFPLPMGGTYTISYSYATVCTWFSKLYYIVVSVAWIISFRIVTNTNSGNSDG